MKRGDWITGVFFLLTVIVLAALCVAAGYAARQMQDSYWMERAVSCWGQGK